MRSPVTGTTIKKQHIRELHDWVHDWAITQPNKRRLEKSCLVALYGATAEDLRRGETRQIAREKCARAYNEMMSGADR